METLNVSISKQRRSPSPNKSLDSQPQVKKSKVLNESKLDSAMKHWEEYRVQGLKIPRRSYHSACSHGDKYYYKKFLIYPLFSLLYILISGIAYMYMVVMTSMQGFSQIFLR